MTHLTGSLTLALLAVVVAASGAAAQDQAVPAARSPRVEFGAGVGGLLVAGEEGCVRSAAHARVSVALTRQWSVDGVFDLASLSPEERGTSGVGPTIGGLYGVLARWAPTDGSRLHGWQPFLTMGGTGWLALTSLPVHRWEEPGSGQVHVVPARTDIDFFMPILPTVGFGVQKVVGSHVALRADLSAVIAIGDDFVAAAFRPSVGVSIPLGKYPRRRR